MLDSAILRAPVRSTARRIGVGRVLLKVHTLRALTLRGAITMLRDRPRYLPRILNAPAIAAGDGSLEIHMLLHHQRILEGIWALYSFAHFASIPCQIFIHDDGSLTPGDAAAIQRVLPGTHVISRAEADRLVVGVLIELGLSASIRFRERLIFALKLLDPFFFGKHSSFVCLDSDVLFFRRPHELVDDLACSEQGEPRSLYSPDNGFRYCASPETLRSLLGVECFTRVNAGLVRSARSVLDLHRIEQYLQHPEFWGSGSRPPHYAEQTLWAMQLTAAHARPLPQSYAITPPLDGPSPASGHFCGGGYPATWFYGRGLPRLARQFGI